VFISVVVERVHGRYIKIHFAVDVRMGEDVAMEVATDDMHDLRFFQD